MHVFLLDSILPDIFTELLDSGKKVDESILHLIRLLETPQFINAKGILHRSLNLTVKFLFYRQHKNNPVSKSDGNVVIFKQLSKSIKKNYFGIVEITDRKVQLFTTKR